MNTMKKAVLGAAALLPIAAMPATAQVRITEVAPWASGNAPCATDWFELTNIGATAIDITGWKMDDSSASFTSAVSLTGITSIAAGESVDHCKRSARRDPDSPIKSVDCSIAPQTPSTTAAGSAPRRHRAPGPGAPRARAGPSTSGCYA